MCDFEQLYRVDLDEEMGRSWYWFATRVYGLLQLPPTYSVGFSGEVLRVQSTRIAHALAPPEVMKKE